MPSRLRHRRLWLCVQVVTFLCAFGLVYQIGENILSLESAYEITHHHHPHHVTPTTNQQGQQLVQSEAAVEEEEKGEEAFFEDAGDDDGLLEAEEVDDGIESTRPTEEQPQGQSDSSNTTIKPVVVDSQDEDKRARESKAKSKRVKRTVSELFKVVNDPDLFRKSEFGYPVDLLVASQNNVKRLRVNLSRPERFLPKRSPFIPEEEEEEEEEERKKSEATAAVKYESCALVGNAGIARAAPFGASIDKHEVVMRINQGPSKDYESIVGSKTTFRLLNKKWASMYTSAQEGRRVFLPNEARNSTILASRVSTRAFEHLASVVRHTRKDLKLLYVAQGLEARARNLLKAFKEASLNENTPVRFEGGDAPSSGFIGFYFLLQICEKVAIYGFSSQKLFGINQRRWPYHYFRFSDFQGLGLHLDSEQLREHPHHSFNAEVEFYSSLSEQTNRTEACFPRGQFTRAKLMKCGVGKGPEPEAAEAEAVTEEEEM